MSAWPEEVRHLEEIGRESKAEKLQGKLERLREIATKGG